jgi:hypothetical protein
VGIVAFLFQGIADAAVDDRAADTYYLDDESKQTEHEMANMCRIA